MHGILALSKSIIVSTFDKKISNIFLMNMLGKPIDCYELQESDIVTKSPRHLESVVLKGITLILLSRFCKRIDILAIFKNKLTLVYSNENVMDDRIYAVYPDKKLERILIAGEPFLSEISLAPLKL